ERKRHGRLHRCGPLAIHDGGPACRCKWRRGQRHRIPRPAVPSRDGTGRQPVRPHGAHPRMALERRGMDRMTQPRGSEAGFSLLEVLVSMLLLMGGLLGLAQVFLLGMAHASTSSANLVAREKA